MHMEATACMSFEYSHVFYTFVIATTQAIIETLPHLLEVLDCHLTGMLVRVLVSSNGEKAPRLMAKSLVERVQQIATPIACILLTAARAVPHLAGYSYKRDETHTKI